jgi:hypothetical protein
MDTTGRDTDEHDARDVDPVFELAFKAIDRVLLEYCPLAYDVGIVFDGNKQRRFAKQ